MTKLRALFIAAALAIIGVGALSLPAPASADQDLPPYVDCASALASGSANTGRMACFDKYTVYGPIFQVFVNWSLYYAAPYTDEGPASNPNHVWSGGEWALTNYNPASTPANGRSRATGAREAMTSKTPQPGAYCSYPCFMARSADPGVLAWWYNAAADGTLQLAWLTR